MTGPEIIYLDQQIWGGLADEYPQYIELKSKIKEVQPLNSLIFPYSIVHIQELSQIGNRSNMTKEERFVKAKSKLDYIRNISGLVFIEPDKFYREFQFIQRDPIEAFCTFTEVELKAASVDRLLEMAPKTMLESLQNSFGVGSSVLYDLSEEDAIQKINEGIIKFTSKCQSDPAFYNDYLEKSKADTLKAIYHNNNHIISTIEESTTFIKNQMTSSELSDAEQIFAQEQIESLEAQRPTEQSLKQQVEEIESAFERNKKEPNILQDYTFESFLKMMVSQDQNNTLPPSFYKTLLLDMFGYKAKIKNRRSDHYDALHREYTRACDYFVTDDPHFQGKMGSIGSAIADTKCILLNSKSLDELLRARLNKD